VNHHGAWRTVHASIPGVAHQTSGLECQDACAVHQVERPDDNPVLVLIAADGAGSAVQSRTGAEQACQALLAECVSWLATATDEDWQPAIAASWLHTIQAALVQQAVDTGLPVREFACTLMGAIVAGNRALFLQIGDGAIVIGTEDNYRPVFWPQSGQYLNETWFVTDPNATNCLECTVLTESITEIALLTDGLQPLALHYQSRQAHEPFFRPMFQGLRGYPKDGCLMTLTHALEQFLDSPAVNQRTHDDKTLILASRMIAPETASATQAEKACMPTTGLQEDAGDEAV